MSDDKKPFHTQEKDGRLKNESTIAEDEELAYVKHLLNKWL